MSTTEDKLVARTIKYPKLYLVVRVGDDKLWIAVIGEVDKGVPMLITKRNGGVVFGRAGEEA